VPHRALNSSASLHGLFCSIQLSFFQAMGRAWPEYGHGQSPNTIRSVPLCAITETPMITRISRSSAVP
jgi:hypothetical protein